MMKTFHLAALAALVAIGSGGAVAPAHAQTAYDINRLNQAVQICNSPMGAGMAECAQLRARMGGGGGGLPGVGGIGGFGGLGGAGKAAGIASLLGSAMSAARSQQAAAAPPPAANPGAIQQAIATCVQNAQGNNTVIQACLQIASAGQAPAPAAGYGQVAGQAMLPTAQRAQDSAMATYAGAQSYQACAAANPTNWQSCLPLMNGGGAAAPAANPFGGLLPRR